MPSRTISSVIDEKVAGAVEEVARIEDRMPSQIVNAPVRLYIACPRLPVRHCVMFYHLSVLGHLAARDELGLESRASPEPGRRTNGHRITSPGWPSHVGLRLSVIAVAHFVSGFSVGLSVPSRFALPHLLRCAHIRSCPIRQPSRNCQSLVSESGPYRSPDTNWLATR